MAKTILLFVVAFFAGIFIQATFVHSMLPDAIAPDILLVLAVFLGLRSRNPGGAFGAFVIGLGADFASGKFLGPFAAGSLAAFLTTAFFANHFFAEKWFTVSLSTLLASLAKNITSALLLKFFTPIDLFTVDALLTLFLEAMLSAFIAPFVVTLLAPRYYSGYSSARRRLKRV